jgi:ribosomal protein S18 acetylase RimI-like enzyme
MIQIISYEDKYQPDFRRLNLEWLDKYHLTESHDLEILDDPMGTVIAGGGSVFLAMHGDEVVGTAGLLKSNEEEYELIKMAVDPGYRGQGISKLLLEKCIDEARERKAEKVILFSNSQLQTAINLYKKYGFEHVPVVSAPFLTADIKMELSL